MKIFYFLLVATLLFSPFQPAQAQADITDKINKLLIKLPQRYLKNEQDVLSFDAAMPSYGGFLINGGPRRQQPIVTDPDIICKLKQAKPDALIFTDQEGGVVRRFRDFRIIGAHHATKHSLDAFYENVLENSKKMKERCIDVNLAPVVNIARTEPVPRSHPRKIDEKRSYSPDIKVVKQYTDAFARATYDAGLIPTAKHYPGDILIDAIAFGSPYIETSHGHRWEMNYIKTDFPLKDNIDAFFFGKPQFLMWSNNIFSRFSDKPAFMVDEFKRWIDTRNCDCLLLTDALDEVKLTKEVAQAAFENADMMIMYGDEKPFIALIKELMKEGIITEQEIDQKIARIDTIKKKMKTP